VERLRRFSYPGGQRACRNFWIWGFWGRRLVVVVLGLLGLDDDFDGKELGLLRGKK
jgi:hypothetical protein